jgi:tetratricopeptide (TPR) repeat protein
MATFFISAVTDEFGSYREPIRANLDRPGVRVEIQERFLPFGDRTLLELDNYIRQCDAVIQLVGERTGSPASPANQDAILARYPDLPARWNVDEAFLRGLSYTQWEAWLALLHGKKLYIAPALAGATPDTPLTDPTAAEAQRKSQTAHLAGLRKHGYYPSDKLAFASADKLVIALLRALHDLLPAVDVHKPNNLPYPSLGTLFKGREAFLETLGGTLGAANGKAVGVVAPHALHGLGGVGKTRAAVEFGWRHEGQFSALLFVSADSPASLNTNLANLVGPLVLNLTEVQAVTDDQVRIAAALRWLETHPGWFLILDNVDTEEAAREAEALLPRLRQGHVVITSRLSDWGAGVEPLDLDVLDETSARDFLLERTQGKRKTAPTDPDDARALAKLLDGLALALEQAGAYIAATRCGLADYHRRWQAGEARVREWFDERRMKYPKSVATTWETTREQLAPASRTLLEILAWLAPEPIPEFLFTGAATRPILESALGDEEVEIPLAELDRFSMLDRVQEGDSWMYEVHRLVQEVTRQQLAPETRGDRLDQALALVDKAAVGAPQDVRTWPTWTPLAPHVDTLAQHADQAGRFQPTARLMNQLGVYYATRSRFGLAEPLYRRALAIDEASYGPDHPTVAIDLNNLALLLRATNRLAEAEPLYRRVVKIFETSLGQDHPNVATALNNLALLLRATNRLAKAEPLFRRVVKIFETSLGQDHPNVATALNNLALLLQATNRLAEAEPLFRRALAIDEASYGPDHPTVAIRLNNLAGLLQATNRLAEAEPLFRRVVKILIEFQRRTGHTHPNFQTVLGNYRVCLQEQGLNEDQIQARFAEILGAVPDPGS